MELPATECAGVYEHAEAPFAAAILGMTAMLVLALGARIYESRYRSELQAERVQLANEVARLADEAQTQGFREGLLELKAPQAGVVQDLATTTLGAVVQPGTVLLTLVPVGEPLVAEVFIRNRDIGFVREVQPARAARRATVVDERYRSADRGGHAGTGRDPRGRENRARVSAFAGTACGARQCA